MCFFKLTRAEDIYARPCIVDDSRNSFSMSIFATAMILAHQDIEPIALMPED